MKLSAVVRVGKRTVLDFSHDNCIRLAAALAYYSIFALPPLLIFLLSIFSLFLNPSDAQGHLANEIQSVAGPAAAEQIQSILNNAQRDQGSGHAQLIGIVALVFGATGVMVQLQGAINDVWEVKPDPEEGGIWNFVTKRLISLVMILVIATLLLVSLILTTVITAIHSTVLPFDLPKLALQAINIGLNLFMMTLLFAAVFKILPDADVSWKNVWIGSALSAILFELGKLGLGVYLGMSDVGSAYGVAGSVILLLIWVYYSSMILLIGTEFTQAWSREFAGGIRPAKGAVRVVVRTTHIKPDGTMSAGDRSSKNHDDSPGPARPGMPATAPIGNNTLPESLPRNEPSSRSGRRV